jgi:hypothetical protein
MDDKQYPVIELAGSWPHWFGRIGMRFLCVYIRCGSASIGTGASNAEALERLVEVESDPSLAGVTDIDDAVRVLRKHGYRVKSIVVPAHIEEIG